jgi:hypothetical protein
MDDLIGTEGIIPNCILEEFQSHALELKRIYNERRSSITLRNVVEDKEDHNAFSAKDSIGKRITSDVYNGDVNLRTLRILLKMIDERGWER